MENDQVLLCWHSSRAGNDVLINAIKSLKNRKIVISKVLLLTQSDQKINLTGFQKGIEIEEILLVIDNPTHHKVIYDRIVETILPKIETLPGLHINVSPGTPAMHAVWLILHAGGRLPNGTKLWSSQKSPDTKRNSIKEVEFPINTYLSEIHALSKGNPSIKLYDMEPKSDSRKQALDSLKRFASLTGIPILVVGERGIGKTRIIETVVKAIKQKNMVTLACGGLDSEVVDSLLFGHKKGAFTGANEDRDGLLKTANQGVLFLDEIQDLPKPVQRKLVRVLQDKQRKYRPVGSDYEISIEFELICASNKSLSELSGILDKDFFDRISMLTTNLPPLRVCREDLLVDWQHVWKELRIGEDYPLNAPVNKDVKDFFSKSSLRGNLRDMQKIACLMMAYWQKNDISKSIAIALNEFEKLDGLSLKQGYEDEILGIESLSRSEILNDYKKRLALQVKNKFGTWAKAADAISCDEKTLRVDAKING